MELGKSGHPTGHRSSRLSMEKRVPVAIVVRLAGAEDISPGAEEITYTENVSLHGARVISKRLWLNGEAVRITSLEAGISLCGKVAYCLRPADDRYIIGLNFQDQPVSWSNFHTSPSPKKRTRE